MIFENTLAKQTYAGHLKSDQVQKYIRTEI